MIPEIQWNLDNITLFSKHLDTLEKKVILTPGQTYYVNEIKFGKELEDKALNPEVVLKVLSLQYRIKEAFGGITRLDKTVAFMNSLVENSLLIQLRKAVKKWKEGNPHYISKEITDLDSEKILVLSRYDRFIPVLLKNKTIEDDFFKLVFRDNFPIKMLIQYYKTCSIDLKNALLTMRVGFFNTYSDQKMAKIEKQKLNDGSCEKDFHFFINRKFTTILDDAALIEMNDGKLHTWKHLKETCAKAKKFPAEMEVFEETGLIFFKPQGLETYLDGKKIIIETTAPNYWESKELPVFLTIFKEKLEKMLNVKITDSLATVEGTCDDPYKPSDSHGASTIYLPNPGGKTYRVYPCGKYAEKFPQTTAENLKFVGDSVVAKFTHPDPTPFYTQRFHGVYPRIATRNEAEELLIEYGKFQYFQFAGNNCSADFQLIFEKKFGDVPDFFRNPILDTNFPNPMSFIYNPLSFLNPTVSKVLVHGIHVLFGSRRELEIKNENGNAAKVSLYESAFCEDQKLFVPGMLPFRILTGEIDGVTYYGYS